MGGVRVRCLYTVTRSLCWQWKATVCEMWHVLVVCSLHVHFILERKRSINNY